MPLHSALERSDDQYAVLRDWVAALATAESTLLDIGAGDGDDDYTALVRPLVSRMVGVDPAAAPRSGSLLDEMHAQSIESFALGGHERFDLALAVYVVEHISDPGGFLTAARRCLRPGGSLFLVTPNLWHYFGLAAKASAILGVDDRLLALTRAAHPGHDHVGHFRVAYKMNSVASLARHAGAAGFQSLEVRHLENPSIFETYFPGRLAALPRLYSSALHLIGAKRAFGTLICRLVNRTDGPDSGDEHGHP